MKAKELNLGLKNKMYALMEKELELAKMKMAKYKDVIRLAMAEKNTADEDYMNFKNNLEKDLGISLDHVAVQPDMTIMKLDDSDMRSDDNTEE